MSGREDSQDIGENQRSITHWMEGWGFEREERKRKEEREIEDRESGNG